MYKRQLLGRGPFVINPDVSTEVMFSGSSVLLLRRLSRKTGNGFTKVNKNYLELQTMFLRGFTKNIQVTTIQVRIIHEFELRYVRISEVLLYCECEKTGTQPTLMKTQ